jgi:hypothetical protein
MTSTATARQAFVDRRTARRAYEPLLPEFFPVKLSGAFISVDFVVGDPFDRASHCDTLHPARRALHQAGVAIDTRVSPRKVLAWLRSMPSYRAGVQLRLGHDADTGLAFEKSAELVELVDSSRSIVYLSRRPFDAAERAFLARPRANLLLQLTATPRSAALGVRADPMELVRSAEGLDARRIHWVLGPLAADSLADAERLVEALPPGSRLTLRSLGAPGQAAPEGTPLPSALALQKLEARAVARRLAVTDWFCRAGLAAVGRGFFDVDRITAQSDLGRRALDLVTCADCPSRTQCHGALDLRELQRRLEQELSTIGLNLANPPARTGPRSLALEVLEPATRGDETYLNHALGLPVSVTLRSREADPTRTTLARDLGPAVLRRWWSRGFLPVTELNMAAQNVLDDLRRRLGSRTPQVLRPTAA